MMTMSDTHRAGVLEERVGANRVTIGCFRSITTELSPVRSAGWELHKIAFTRREALIAVSEPFFHRQSVRLFQRSNGFIVVVVLLGIW